METRRVRVVAVGRVQGVWFRAWTVEQATGRGLDGWVRNRFDGSVEAVFAGPSDAVAAMVAACRDGPPLAEVVDLTVEDWLDAVEPGFAQRPSG